MKLLLVSTLIVFGGFWILWSTTMKSAFRMGAMSHSYHFESSLYSWAHQKMGDGKLSQKDVDEIFNDRTLRIGGESPDDSFHEMVEKISEASAPPLWPGVAAVIIGCIGAFKPIRQK